MDVYDLSGKRKNACSNLRRCPASYYHNCSAYKKGLNCWDVEDVPCCRRNDKSRCSSCTLFRAYLFGSTTQTYPRTTSN